MHETEKKLNEILIAEYFGCILIAFATAFSFYTETDSLILNHLKEITGVFIAIILMRKISGAYFNPGVFVMFLKLKNTKFYKRHFFSYILTQCAGATSGFLIFTFLTLGNLSVPFDINLITYQNCFVGEFISSFFFYLLIVVTADPEYSTSGDYVFSTVSIFAGIGCGYALGWNLSGSSMNPSNAIGALFVAFLNTANVKFLFIGFVYFFTPILAGFSVVSFYVNFIKNGANPFEDKKMGCKLQKQFKQTKIYKLNFLD